MKRNCWGRILSCVKIIGSDIKRESVRGLLSRCVWKNYPSLLFNRFVEIITKNYN